MRGLGARQYQCGSGRRDEGRADLRDVLKEYTHAHM